MFTEIYAEPEQYNRDFPPFERPKVVGYIGIENLKYARRVCYHRAQYDLNLHMDKVIRKPPDLDVKLTELLKFLLENEARLNYATYNKITNTMDTARFFCYRGLLTCVACTPYENQEPWKIVALLFKGNIFLCARDTADKIAKKKNMSEREKKFCSWGYKFEQYILSDDPDSEPNPDVPVDETEEFSLVFTTKLRKHTIVFGAEMDGIRCDKKRVGKPPLEDGVEAVVNYLSSKEFVELKTSRHIENLRQETNFRRFKAKKWWCQSFLVGIDTILCGYRNDDGIVEEVRKSKVNDLPKKAQQFWNPNVCFNFLEMFLMFVKKGLATKAKYKYGAKAKTCFNSLPLISLMFEWEPGQTVKMTDNYSHEDDPILPTWFLENYGSIKLENSE